LSQFPSIAEVALLRDWALPRELLVQSFASMHLDIAGAKSIAARLVSGP
jgi:hypothetical protein